MKWRVLAALTALAVAFPLAAFAQEQAIITGKVTSEAGAPIGGAQVYLDKMGIGTTTKDDGTYRFSVPAARATGQQATLVAQIIGFKAKSQVLTLSSGSQNVDFTLTAAPVVLSQIVITGEGTITTAEKLGATVNKVEGSHIVAANEPNVTNALAGKAPNVQVQSQSGDPGSSTSIQIRGLKSMSGDGQPLFVVDGVPVDNQTVSNQGFPYADVVAPNRISDINPNDIESVTILKGAAASAIYGARAAQGVVMITTKTGKSGATVYNLRSSYSFDDVSQGFPLQTTYSQGGEDENGVPQPGINPTPDEQSGRFSFGPKLAAGTPTYDHFAELFRTGHVWDNALSIAGGDDRRSFYFSAGYMTNQGFVDGPDNSYNRTTVRLKGTQMLASSLKIGANFTYIDTRGKFIQRGDNVSGIMLDGLRTPPEFNNKEYLDPVNGLHRSFRFQNPTSNSLQLSRGYDNPFFVINEEPATSSLNRFMGNVDVVWDATDWLKIQETVGGDYYTDGRYEALPLTNSTSPGGQIIRADFNNYILDNYLTAIASHTFSPNFSASLTVGQNLNSSNFREVFVNGFQLVTPEPLVISNTQNWLPNDSAVTVHREGYFAQATADLWDQLFLAAAVRNDGYSTFGASSRRHWFPKASAAWTFTKKTGDAGGFLNYGKVRAAYGEAGKEPDPYSTLTVFGVGQYPEFGGDAAGFLKTTYMGQPGLQGPNALGSDSLRPERTKEWEGGIDLGVYHGFADLSLAYYHAKSSDVIFQLPTAPSSGATSIVANSATIQNVGWEVNANFHILKGNRPVTWDLGLLWGQNRNEVLSLASGVTEVAVPASIAYEAATVARPGSPVGAIEGNDFFRCGRHETLPDGSSLDDLCAASHAPKGALYVAANGFPVVDTDTLLIMGSYQPNWAGSLRTSLTFWKHLDFSALVDVRSGSQAYNGTRGALYVFGTHKDTELRYQTVVFGPSANGVPGFHGDKAVVGPGAGQAVLINSSWWQGDASSFSSNTGDFIEDAGFVKLREISVGYSFTESWVTKAGLSSIDLRVAGRNLHTWTDYRGIDPETNNSGATLVQGIDWFNNPQTRSFVITIGLNR